MILGMKWDPILFCAYQCSLLHLDIERIKLMADAVLRAPTRRTRSTNSLNSKRDASMDWECRFHQPMRIINNFNVLRMSDYLHKKDTARTIPVRCIEIDSRGESK